MSSGFYFHMTFRFVTAVRGTLVSMIYGKTVNLSIVSVDESAAVTLMSNDTETICAGLQNLHELWAVPVELGLALWLLERQIGLPFIAPAVVAITSTVITIGISRYIGGSQKIWNAGIQLRVNVTTSMLGSIKAVKILGLTPHIEKVLQGLRVDELRLASLFRRLLSASAFFSNSMRVLAPFVTFSLIVVAETSSDRVLDAGSAFTTLSLIAMLSDPVGTLLRTIPLLNSATACFDRIQSFLLSQSRQSYLLPLGISADMGDHESLQLRQTSSVVIGDSGGYELQVIKSSQQIFSKSLSISVRNASFAWKQPGSYIVNDISFSIHKSSFVFIVGPETAYVDQTPWVQNNTIRENIIGAGLFDQSWYDEIIRACSLDSDIARMPDLHATIVGSRGISLSGGQKQRLALARALYAKKELLAIDDGFSGLDGETEENIFSRVFGKHGLLRKLRTTVVFATNAVHRLSYADHIISLDPTGHISEQGGFTELRVANGYVGALATRHKYDDGSAEEPRQTTAGKQQNYPGAPSLIIPEQNDMNRTISELSTYKYYFASIGWYRSLLSLSYLMLSGISVKMTELLVTKWTKALSAHGTEVNGFYLGMFGMLAGLGAVMWLVATYHYFLSVVPSSSEKLHARLLKTVMNAPLHFFSSTDTGTTTNRFSQDMSVVDKELPFALIDLVVATIQALLGAVFMCLAAGYFALIMPPVAFVIWKSLSGLATIRAFGWSDGFVLQNQLLLDNSQKPYYLLFCIQRWLALVLDLLVAVLAIILMVLVVTLRKSVTPGYVGLALLNVMNFSQSLAWAVRQWTALETSIGAISRLKTFTTLVPNENLAAENQTVSSDWPTHGAIEFKNITASYTSEGRPVLQELNMSIKPGEKLGVCGHTGSGKSSLIMTLFRLLELSPSSSILIDGVDISTLPRQLIRSRLNGIPQDPASMKGSVAFNLSPNLQHSNAEMIQALNKVQLWDIVEAKGGLEVEVNAELFSHGQLQLFCLARSILRKSKIVVLDEVSSNIDIKTDEVVQRIIREEFADATVLSVAHRLDTILDFDRIALLGEGKLVEIDTPQALLSTSSAFKDLYES
ncbi:multidrug resistance-associated protein 1 [Phlyctema vagabunda]|uniref:Multidrug resistance-associated protein 1 n=1 Tax=Phlyctema vagabunda TaxID=108571 RepID=A0ABR4P1C7_9HELO